MTKVTPIQLQKYLKEVDYPASKQDLITHALQQGADEEALKALSRLSEKQYETPAAVSQSVVTG
jgi:hypothetical protein